MYLHIRAHHRIGVCVVVHIGVGFGVACSGEWQYQSQCSGTATVQSRFFVVQNAEHYRR